MRAINFNDTIVSNNRFMDKLEKICIIKGKRVSEKTGS